MIPIALALAVLSLRAQSEIVPKSMLPQQPASSKTLATVDGLTLKADEVESMTWDILHKQVEEDYVDYLVVKSAADKVGMSLSEADLKSNFDDVLGTIKKGLKTGQTVDGILAERQFTPARLYLRLKTQLLLNKLQLHELDVKKWVKVSTIIFPVSVGNPNAFNDAATRATEAYTQLEKGTPWDTVLDRATSDARVQAAKGGIGWHTVDVFPKMVQEDLASIKVGAYTRPARTENGVQIFRLDMRGADAAGNDLKALQKQFLDSNAATYFAKLKAAAKITRG